MRRFHCLINDKWQIIVRHTLPKWKAHCADKIYIENAQGRTKLIKNRFGAIEAEYLSADERNIKDILE